MTPTRTLPVAALLLATTAGCGLFTGSSGRRAASPEPEQSASFHYATRAKATTSANVSIGLIAPQFVGDGVTYWREYQSDPTTAGMVRALRASLGQLLTAKPRASRSRVPSSRWRS